MTFAQFELNEQLLSTLQKAAFSVPTPIQEQSIPHILAGRDIFGCAQTGTGKTAAFALPVIQHLTQKSITGNQRKIRTLVLAPTRELALQISEQFKLFSAGQNLFQSVIFGGVSQHKQTSELRRGVDIVIATPGRLMDLMNQGFVDLRNIEHLILDEADRMLDMGFINDIRKIISKLPVKRQTLFFSATISKEIAKLAEGMLKNPVQVSVNPVSSTAVKVEQRVYHVRKENKRSLLKHVLNNEQVESAIVFTRTKRGADRVAKDLNNIGIKAEAIHGNKSQNAREKALSGFKSKRFNILVATDIASRGIDVSQLSHVINYEIPEQAETYVHRIGRTGRAGHSGTALSFCDENEAGYLKDINKLIRKPIEVVNNHPFLN
ncbi:MAG TPA: DEAD/DEAH box helicase [Flavobacteriales bacterium]|nr:DEAD/DEAH box helicase [Flavobacteriales bacterium]HRJ36471.1 DEAD/DEAH box helicase [Flavobacteriales bacterium]HRJ38496.1 DEAD/DEAH box helicase [Flavobacteriales bacterium]